MNKDLQHLINSIKSEHHYTHIGPNTLLISNVDKEKIMQLKKLNANITEQDHGNTIQIVKKINSKTYDGLISTNKDDHMIVYTADCLPILGVNEHSHFLIHSGWKGLLNGILKNLIQHPLIQGYYDIYIAPHISKVQFKVSHDFIEIWSHEKNFAKYHNNNTFDLSGYAKSQLQSITKSIHISDICTYSDERFASFRRSGNRNKTNLTIHNCLFED